jgi:hypothetical protein
MLILTKHLKKRVFAQTPVIANVEKKKIPAIISLSKVNYYLPLNAI